MLSKEVLQLISNVFKDFSVTEATIRNKDSMWQLYIDFCQWYNENPLPATGDLLVEYSVYLIVQWKCCIPTVRNHLSTIKRHQKLSCDIDVPFPSQYLPLLATLKGGAKYLGRSEEQKFPVTPNLLAALTLSLPKDSPYRTAYNVFFFGLPRVGNILPYDGREFDKVKHLTWRRVSVNFSQSD